MAGLPYHTVAVLDVGEPIELRLDRSHGGRRVGSYLRPYVLAFWRHDDGMLGHSLSINGDGVAESLSNLQAKLPWPKKGVAGWQAEVFNVVESGLYKVLEVR